MTQAEFVALAPRVSFRGGCSFWLPEVFIDPLDDGGAQIRVLKRVPDRVLAIVSVERDVVLPYMSTIQSVYLLTAKELARSSVDVGIRRLLFFVRDALAHEIDESLCLDGHLADDTHKDELPDPDYVAFLRRAEEQANGAAGR